MKTPGIALLVLGALAFLFGFNMDTSVATALGDRRVHNIGLMNDRQNFIIFAAVLTVIGSIFVARSGSSKQGQIEQEGGSSSHADTRKCPFCAESIKADAIICRFCQKDTPPISESESMANEASNATPAAPSKAGRWNYIGVGVGAFALVFVFFGPGF